jgi:type VI secretion system protein ImpC
MKLGALLTLDEIPFYYYNDAYGDQTALPCTERLINVAAAQYATAKGFVPLLSMAGRAEVRLGGLNAISGVSLAGPWAPVTFDGLGQAVPAVSSSTEEWKPQEPKQQETTPVAPLADSPATSEGVDELDALLASLESSDSPAPAASDSSDMDPDLAALLADL